MKIHLKVGYLDKPNKEERASGEPGLYHEENLVWKEERVFIGHIVRYHEPPGINGKTLIFLADGGKLLVNYTPEEIDHKVNQARFELIPN